VKYSYSYWNCIKVFIIFLEVDLKNDINYYIKQAISLKNFRIV